MSEEKRDNGRAEDPRASRMWDLYRKTYGLERKTWLILGISAVAAGLMLTGNIKAGLAITVAVFGLSLLD